MLIRGHEIHVEAHGPQDGPAVALLHHGLGSARAWKAQVPALVEAGYRAIAYDRWGYGRSAPRPELDVPAFAADLADLEALMDNLRLERAALVGHSDGGTLALRYAALHIDRVVGLALAAAHIYVEPKMKTGIDAVSQVYQTEAGFREGLRRVHGEKSEAVFENWFSGWRRKENLTWDMRPELASIRCPALVIQGTEDEHATPRHAQDLAAALANSELWLVEGAAHMVPQERPEAFNRRLLQFLARLQ